MEFNELSEKLVNLINEDPTKAIQEAKKLNGNTEEQLLKASVFIDAGGLQNDIDIVNDGVDIFRKLLESEISNQNYKYCLANGLHALSIAKEAKDNVGFLETYDLRFEARKLFYDVNSSNDVLMEVKSGSLTNLGNLLKESNRWLEAYDFYMDALKNDRKNGTASYAALGILQNSLANGIGDFRLLNEEIERLAYHVKFNIETVRMYSGQTGVDRILSNIKGISLRKTLIKGPIENSFEEFVITNNLTLSPTVHFGDHQHDKWDILNIDFITTSKNDVGRLPDIFIMFNILKSDFILARKLYFDALNNTINDTGDYNDSLDYAFYGANISALTIAQRVSYDVLDKIAVAIRSYLNIGRAKLTDFKTFYKNGNDVNHVKIQEEIDHGNTALTALIEVSKDLYKIDGFLNLKNSMRNSSTHRFTVLHEPLMSSRINNGSIEHYDYDTFVYETLQTLKLTRSSLVYIVQMVNFREERLIRESEVIQLKMNVPVYDDFKGGKDTL
jgi:tetratricopeptide (TPR) repeat protein